MLSFEIFNPYNFVTEPIHCIPESFITNIPHRLFDYKITFVNSQRKNKNLEGDFVLKNWFETFNLKISGKQKHI